MAVFLQSACGWTQQRVSTPHTTDSIADRVLVYQLSNGGWPKQLADKSVVDYQQPLDENLKERIRLTGPMYATIDNHATSREIRLLVNAFKNTGKRTYLKAAERGVIYLLDAQYRNGGWPQFYPDTSNYRSEITYNDHAMINALEIMWAIVEGSAGFDAMETSLKPRARQALERGISCVLKTQVIQSGKRTIWAAQYDAQQLSPAKARSFEPAALSVSESVGIVRFLMRIKSPSEEVKMAIQAAVTWLEQHQIKGVRFDQLPAGNGKGLVPDSTAISWSRFYDLETNRPLFGDRDHRIYYDVMEISEERRNGYAWYGSWALSLIRKEYPEWKKKQPISSLFQK